MLDNDERKVHNGCAFVNVKMKKTIFVSLNDWIIEHAVLLRFFCNVFEISNVPD